MRVVAIVICLLLVAGCGGPDSATPTTGSGSRPSDATAAEASSSTEEPATAITKPTATTTADPCAIASQTSSSRKLASIAPVEDETRTLATSWVMLKDINELAWASHLIVRGRVVADCGEDDGGQQQTMPDFDPRMLVEIDAHYRGQPRETILVPATSDSNSSDSGMLMNIGAQVILFLHQPDDGGAIPVGGPQGHWRVIDDRAVPNAGHFPSLPVETFEQSLAAALHQEPPATIDVQTVSLDAAPLGPDLPGDTEPPAACDGVVPPTSEYIERSSDLVWLSELVVIGTIGEVRAAFYPDANPVDSSLRVPVTDYVVNVEQYLRGTTVETLTLRQPGGTVDGCAVRVSGAPDLQVGDRLLLFLTPQDESPSLYQTTAGQRGIWEIGEDGALAANTAWQSYPQVVPTDDLVGLVATALNGEMPHDQWVDYDPVPLDVSPLGDTNWPALEWTGPVSPISDPDGQLTLDLPDGWTVLPPLDGSLVTLASWPEAPVDEPVPAGHVRITIHQTRSDNWFDDPSSVPVSTGGTTGWLRFFADHWPVDAAASGQTWGIHANYFQTESRWIVQATFGSQPLADDAVTTAFFALLRSIRHA